MLPGYTTVVVPKGGHIEAPDGLPILYLCAETNDYRRVARTAPAPAVAVEIGCSYGACSKILAKRSSSLIGIDIAAEPIAAARAACDLLSNNCKFYQMDVFRDPSALESVLLSTCAAGADSAAPAEGGPSALFIDIGGEGLLKRCQELIDSPAITALAPSYICVKNRALCKSAVAAGTPPESNDSVGRSYDNARYRNVTKSSKSYALDFEPKLVPGSLDVFMCRFHNFYEAGCTRAVCTYDHELCYFCCQPGHKAIDGVCVPNEGNCDTVVENG